MEQEIFTEEIINKKELKEELTHAIHFLDHNVDAKNPADLNSFFDMIKQIVQKNQVRIVRALMEELCAEKNMDYDEYILNTMFRKISENEQFKEIMDLMKNKMQL